jgi:hypothetical protein
MALSAGLLAGCAADYKLFVEDASDPATDISEPCRYAWVADTSMYRAFDSSGYGWSRADRHGLPGLLPYLQEISSKCANTAPRGAPEAHVSAYNLEYVDRKNRMAMAVPVFIAETLTLGLAPFTTNNYFAVCLEARLPDGQRRAAMTRGTLESVTNIWGTMNTPTTPGGTLRQKNKDHLLQHLTQQSWNKLWAAGETLPGNAACRDTLDSLAKT